MEKIKDVAANLAETGSKLYSKLTGLWGKNWFAGWFEIVYNFDIKFIIKRYFIDCF